MLRWIAAVGLLHLVAGGAGFIASRLGIPLPWMIGPLIVAAATTLAFDAPRVPRMGRYAGQIVVGAAVGLYLTPEALARITSALAPILASAALTVLGGCLAAVMLARFARVDWTTALFAGIPGGPMEMATLAEQRGGTAGQVALAQTLRIMFIVLIVPLSLLVYGEHLAPPLPSPAVHFPGLLWLLAIAVGAGVGFARVTGSSPYFLGPMAAVGALTATGHNLSAVPEWALAAGQVLLGVSLGTMVRRQVLTDTPRFLLAAFCTTIFLILLCGAVAALLSVVFEMPFATLAASTAPGSVTEMVVTASAMNLDVSLVAAFHVVRIFLLLACLPPIYYVLAKLHSYGRAR